MVAAVRCIPWRPALLVALVFLVAGCGSARKKQNYYLPLETELRTGDYAAAVDRIETARGEGLYKDKERFLYYMDAGLAYHYASQFDSSNLRLSEAERTAYELYTKSVSKGILANTLLNDNVLEYGGEDYEELYANLIMALNYLELGRFDDAFVEVRRANEKLDLLEQKYVDAAERMQRQVREDTAATYVAYEPDKLEFNNSAFARYLSMHIYAADRSFDDARIDYEHLHEAFATQPHIYEFSPPDVAYAVDGEGVLSVVGLIGLAPVKEALNLRIRTDENLHVLTVIYSDTSAENSVFANYPLPDNVGDFYAKLSIPQLVPRPSEVAAIRIIADSIVVGELGLLEDVSQVTATTYRTKQGMVLWRTVVRTIAKTLAASAIKNKVDDGGLAGWLGKLATDVAYDLSESADLRCAHLLPGRVFVGDFPIAVGTYDLAIEFLAADGSVIERRYHSDVRVRDGAFNLVRAICLR